MQRADDDASGARTVPIEELIKPPSKRQIRRNNDLHKKTITRASDSAEKRGGKTMVVSPTPAEAHGVT